MGAQQDSCGKAVRFMVAWWLRIWSVFNLLCVVAWCIWAWSRSPWLAAGGVVLFMLAGRIWLGLQFLIMRSYKRSRQLPVPPAAQWLPAWNAETQDAARQFAWQIPWAEWAVPDHLPADAQGRTGVVLVHGWLCNRAVWTAALRELRSRNIPFVAVSLPLLLHRIERARPALDAAVRQLYAATGRAPVIVAHSMGGLVVRDWLQSGASRDMVPRDVVTVGSPHHGSVLAHCVWGANVRQMRTGSPWLARLQEAEARPGAVFSSVRWHCFYSNCDNVVFPESAATLAGFEAHSLDGMAHVQMLNAPSLWACVQALVRQ